VRPLTASPHEGPAQEADDHVPQALKVTSSLLGHKGSTYNGHSQACNDVAENAGVPMQRTEHLHTDGPGAVPETDLPGSPVSESGQHAAEDSRPENTAGGATSSNSQQLSMSILAGKFFCADTLQDGTAAQSTREPFWSGRHAVDPSSSIAIHTDDWAGERLSLQPPAAYLMGRAQAAEVHSYSDHSGELDGCSFIEHSSSPDQRLPMGSLPPQAVSPEMGNGISVPHLMTAGSEQALAHPSSNSSALVEHKETEQSKFGLSGSSTSDNCHVAVHLEVQEEEKSGLVEHIQVTIVVGIVLSRMSCWVLTWVKPYLRPRLLGHL